jgi:type IV pilus assembly protein PilZ
MREPRYAVDISVDETTTEIFTGGRVTNISRGGLFIETSNPLPLQTAVDLVLRLPEIATVIKLSGRVVWTYDVRRTTSRLMTGSGIKFMDMSPDQRDVLEGYLARIVREDEPPACTAALA